MKGLKTQESSKFQRFFEIVQNTAQKQGKVFFADAGDGRDIVTDEFEGEDLTGWLVPASKVDEFMLVWENNRVDDTWVDFFTFAVWKMDDGKLSITFE